MKTYTKVLSVSNIISSYMGLAAVGILLASHIDPCLINYLTLIILTICEILLLLYFLPGIIGLFFKNSKYTIKSWYKNTMEFRFIILNYITCLLAIFSSILHNYNNMWILFIIWSIVLFIFNFINFVIILIKYEL